MVLELCSKFKKKVLIASTSEVYGKHMDAPLQEDMDCIYGAPSKWRWSYAAAKLIDEFMGLAYYRKKHMPVVIFRLFNTVGPRQSKDFGMVLPNFIHKALLNEPIIVFGDGKQTRSFCYITDTVTGLMLLAINEKAKGEVVNIGNSQEVTILELANKIKEVTKCKSSVTSIRCREMTRKDAAQTQTSWKRLLGGNQT